MKLIFSLKTKRACKVIVIIFVVVFSVVVIRNHMIEQSKRYDEDLEINWGITIPADCEILYGLDQGPNVFGDGDRFHALSCNENALDDLDDLPWTDAAEDDVAAAKEIMDNLQVPESERPDLEHGQWKVVAAEKNTWDKLYMFYDGEKLYICERLI